MSELGGDVANQKMGGENGRQPVHMAQAEKIMSDKRQATISDVHAALQFESSQMQKADFLL
jgi:hypothetical protein